MAPDTNGIQGIEETMRRYAEGYGSKDIDMIAGTLSPTVQGFGTGPDEVIRNREEALEHIRRDIDQCESVQVRMDDMRVSGTSPVAWLTAFCTFTVTAGGETSTLAGRFTAVLRKADVRWLIEQIHYSLPAAGQEGGRSYPGA